MQLEKGEGFEKEPLEFYRVNEVCQDRIHMRGLKGQNIAPLPISS